MSDEAGLVVMQPTRPAKLEPLCTRDRHTTHVLEAPPVHQQTCQPKVGGGCFCFMDLKPEYSEK